MANVAIDGLGSTYVGNYASKILLEPVFQSDDVMKNYTIYPNVKYKQNIVMAPRLASITALHSGCGTTNTCNPAGFNVIQKTITAENVSVKQVQCWDEFKDQVIVESYKNGVNMSDLTGTQLAQVIIDRVRGGIASDLVRNMWAGLATVPAGVDCSYGSMGAGLWDLMSTGGAFTGGGAVGAMTYVVGALPAGTPASASYATIGGVISVADVTKLLDTVFNQAPAALQQVDARDKKMFVTPNIYNAWYSALTAVAVSGSVDGGHGMAQEGKAKLYYRGIELVAMYEWDVALGARTGANTPTAFKQTGKTTAAPKNGVIYSAKANLFIGTDVSRPENELKIIYDEVSENMYIRSAFTMGFQYGWDSLVTGASLGVV
jgi:hypothetical protein